MIEYFIPIYIMAYRYWLFSSFIFLILTSSCQKKNYTFQPSQVPKTKEVLVFTEDIESSLLVYPKKKISTLPPVLAEKSVVKSGGPQKQKSHHSIAGTSLRNFTDLIPETIHSTNEVTKIVPEKEINYFHLFVLALFFPPIAVGLKKSFSSWQFFLTLGLTLSFFVPGMVFAVITILKERRRENRS